ERAQRILRQHRWRHIKVKVGREDDTERLAAIRRELPQHVEIRVDANACWSADEAVEKAKELATIGINVIEQPVAAHDLDGMRRVRESGAIVIADEGVCGAADLERHISARACDVVNVRLAKCGGLLASAEICRLALAAGV